MTDQTPSADTLDQERAMGGDNVHVLRPTASEPSTIDDYELLEETVPFLTSLDIDLRSRDLPPDATIVVCNVVIQRQGAPIYCSADMMLAATNQTLPPEDTELLSSRMLTLGALMVPLRNALNDIVAKWKQANVG